ncbi:Transducin beta-like protein 3 [Astathelohania contejeani]|uniref:Transducin beta-like protein 3 n=1 Tax=Astathelohania contejeani TaxID=164912 RepID=A0ABQ7I2R4_9MICR|nr:Transducin beta-like protein 3 [Thelohania contejeani]
MISKYIEKKSIVPIYLGGTIAQYNNQLYTTNQNKIFITDINTCHTRFIEFPGQITTFNIYRDILSASIGTSVFILDTTQATSISDAIKIHFKNFSIKCIKQINGKLVLCNDKRSIQIFDINNEERSRIDINGRITAMEVCNGCVTNGNLSGGDLDLVLLGDEKGNIHVYNLKDKTLLLKFVAHTSEIKGIFFDGRLYSASGTEFTDWKNKQTKSIEIEKIVISQTDSINDNTINKLFYFINETGLWSYNLEETKIIRKGKFINMAVEKNDIWCTTDEFEIIGNDITFIGYNDEITDLLKIDNKLFIATNSGRLRFIHLEDYLDISDNTLYACKATLLEGHSDVIMKLSYVNNLLMSVSKDNKMLFWDLENMEIKKVIQSHTKGINCCAMGKEIFVSGGSDSILQIWKKNEEMKNIFTQMIHSKEINSVEINEKRKIIVTASLDKTIKVFDFSGILKKECLGHKKGVWSLALGDEVWISGSSDKTVRVWDYSYNCIGVLQCESAILKCLLYENEKMALTSCGDGCMIVWDLKKKLKLTTMVLEGNIWGMIITKNNIWAGENGAIRYFLDVTEEYKKEKIEKEKRKKEVEFLINKHQSDNLYLVRLYFENDLSGLLKAVEKCGVSNDLMEIFSYDLIRFKKWLKEIASKIRNCEIANLLINAGIKRGWFKGHEFGILEKHVKAVDELYIELLGNELLFT